MLHPLKSEFLIDRNCEFFSDGFYLICMNEFESASHLLMMFSTGVEETRRWLEMMAMAQDEYRCLQRSAATHGEYGILNFKIFL